MGHKKNAMSGDLCCICLDGYDNNAAATTFPCGHRMHTVCMRQYIRSSVCTTVTTCPLCRQPIVEDLAPPPTPQLLVPILVQTIHNRADLSQQESAADRQYRRGVYYITAVFMMILFVVMLLFFIAYYV